MKNFSRRRFIQSTMIGAAGITAFPFFQSFTTSTNNTIRIGFIGLGQQAINLLNGFSRIPGVQIVAGADVYGIKRQRFELWLTDFYQSRNESVKVKTYKD